MPKIVDHNKRREQIAEAAWRIIEREGFGEANLRKIAQETGHTTGVVTHYFRDKHQLMAFAFGLVVERSTSRMAKAAEEVGVMEALAQLLPLDEQRLIETRVWLALMSASSTDSELAVELRQRYRKVREATWPILQTAIEKRRAEELDDVADELMAVVDGITVDALADPERYPPDRQLALLRRALVRLGLPAKPPVGEKSS